MSGGVETKVIALGIGSGVNVPELQGMASPPQDKTVILVQDFNSLSTVRIQLLEETCNGKHGSFVVVLKQLNEGLLSLGWLGGVVASVLDS